MRNGDQKVRVEWLRYEPTFYYDSFMRVLAREPALHLTVHYDVKIRQDNPWQTPLREGYRSRVRPRGAAVDWDLLRRVACRRGRVFVLAGWWTPTMFATANALMARRMPYLVFTDTPYPGGWRARGAIRWFRAWWLRRLFRRAHAVLATGRVGVQAVLDMGCPEHKAVDFPYFVELPTADELERVNRHKDPTTLVFLGCGRLVPQKGYDVAVRAFAAAVRSTGLAALLVIGGTGPEKDALQSLADAMGVGGRVLFPGWLEPQQVRAWLQKAHVFVHSPVAHDAFGVSVLEAMAWGLPVCGSSAAGAVVDRVVHGSNGFVHDPGCVEELAEHLASFMRSPDSIVAAGRAARATAEEWPISRGVGIIRRLTREALVGQLD